MPEIERIQPGDDLSESADVVGSNVDVLSELFPEAFTEDGIDFDVLKQLLGGEVAEGDEKFGLNWHGKRDARRIALTPSTGTLRPCPEESVDWDTTQNLMIEGDNLEVLKLLQKSYSGKVKLIYIDPPYNTGKDFVYKDNFQDNIKNYLEVTGQVDGEGKKLSTNFETSGRFHTDWLNMMYPRLKLARNLLRDDGVIFVSIDDGELENLRLLMNEVFGEENFVAQIVWKKRSSPPNDTIIGANHDYIVVHGRAIDDVHLGLRPRSEEQVQRYKNPDNHPKGPWAAADLMANVKGGRFVASLNYPIVNPNTGEEHYPGAKGNWRFARDKVERLIENDEIYFGADGHGRPKLKRFLADVKDGVTYPTIWDFVPMNTSGSREMATIFGSGSVFESPKPVDMLRELMRLGAPDGGLCLDFFAGSGTLGHANWVRAAEIAEVPSRFILVQLPESTGTSSEASESGFPTISDLTKERLRRAGVKVKAEHPEWDGDVGFRVFKLDSSNIRAWSADSDDVEESLLTSLEHVVEGRTDEDLLYEVLLKLGLDLCVPIERREFDGVAVSAVGGGVLFGCLGALLSADQVELVGSGIVAWIGELSPEGDVTVVFRDSAFKDDVAKTNMAAILEQGGVTTVRSI